MNGRLMMLPESLGMGHDIAFEPRSSSNFSFQDVRTDSQGFKVENPSRRDFRGGSPSAGSYREQNPNSYKDEGSSRREYRGGHPIRQDYREENPSRPIESGEENPSNQDVRRGNHSARVLHPVMPTRQMENADSGAGNQSRRLYQHDFEERNPSRGMGGQDFKEGNRSRQLYPQDFREESFSRRPDVLDLNRRPPNQRIGDARRLDPREHHQVISSDTRRQWRPTAVQGNHRDQSSQSLADAGQMPPNTNSSVVSPEALETSREAVEEVLQSLSIRREQGDFNRIADTHRQHYNPKPRRNRIETFNQVQTSVSSNAMRNVAKDKANTPQLVQEIEEKLSRGQIECMICYDMVRREAAVWSCGGCYAIFHIPCIRKWARAPISADFSLVSSNQATVGNWRCPGCQSPQFVSAEEIKYRCFCGQVLEHQVDYYLTPHSCGGPCKKSLSSGKSPHCKHICTMQCHPGPCPPCNALAPPQFCPCGKTSYTQRCSELKSAKSCGQTCGHQLQCGRHYCDKICHEGPCGSCDTLLTVNCFCRRKIEAMTCGTMGLQGELDWENGVFSCENPCPNKLQCGKHTCNKSCHPGQCGECELAPGKIQTCPCGKVLIQKLLGAEKLRESCIDAVPHCGQICQKLLPCGNHVCQSMCHMGDCPPCEVLVDQKCRCKSSSQKMPCHKALALERGSRATAGEENEDELFLCNRKCGKKKSCGRHRCSNRCCPLASEDNNLPPGEDDPHLCSLSCGKKLRCGQHTCEDLCHNGHCPPCLGSTFTELSCACGKTSIPPPVPCGTFPPSCPHPCSQPQPCGHAPTHQCHFGECPPCIVLTSKECVGSHVILRNVPCGSRDIKCNKLCGKTRQCQLHACARLCHLPPCDTIADTGDDIIMSCGQQCGAPRRDCQHVCVALCHPSAPCPETRCKFPVTITCSCGLLSHQVPCNAGESSKGSDSLELAYYSNLPLQPVDVKTRVPLGQRKLACDEECAKLEKKRILADAFGITATPVDPALSVDSVQIASEVLKELLKKDPQWVLAIEDRFKYLVLGSKSTNAAPIRVHVFSFLPKEKREVLRQIAERWNLTVSAVGREPKRFLTAHVNSKSRAPPMRSLFGRSPLPLPGQAQAPAFNASLDMDPRLVVGLFELPRDGDISTLVLRFGGECELVWLNDKNALAVFSDMMRAATAIRRVDHASAYSGAVRTSFPTATSSVHVWGFNEDGGASKGLPRKKNIQESSWSEDAWGEEWGRSKAKTVWDGRGPAITTSVNPWGALEQDEALTRNSVLVLEKPTSSSGTATGVSQHLERPAPNVAADNWEDLDG